MPFKRWKGVVYGEKEEGTDAPIETFQSKRLDRIVSIENGMTLHGEGVKRGAAELEGGYYQRLHLREKRRRQQMWLVASASADLFLLPRGTRAHDLLVCLILIGNLWGRHARLGPDRLVESKIFISFESRLTLPILLF